MILNVFAEVYTQCLTFEDVLIYMLDIIIDKLPTVIPFGYSITLFAFSSFLYQPKLLFDSLLRIASNTLRDEQLNTLQHALL